MVKVASLVLAIISIGISGPALAQVDLDDSFPSNDDATFEDLHEMLAPHFNDPLSAQYRDMEAIVLPGPSDAPPALLFCGWVNTRNEQGGYGPFQFFLAQVDLQEVEIDQPTPFTLSVAEQMGCPFRG